MIALLQKINSYGAKPAIKTPASLHSFEELDKVSDKCAARLLSQNSGKPLWGQTVAFIAPSGFEYAAMIAGIWKAGGIAVPLCTSHPLPELEYVLSDSKTSALLCHPQFENLLKTKSSEMGIPFFMWDELENFKQETLLPDSDPNSPALIIYTSGTTGKPKGAVTRHSGLEAQMSVLSEAWGWTANDYILNLLPLHHVHGLVNILLCSLYNGALCYMKPNFDAPETLRLFANEGFTLFMAVPTVYSKLTQAYHVSEAGQQNAFSSACRDMRLMVSGSAALPLSVLEAWKNISGHFLLERYGMTELGMALSNPYFGERRAGAVGFPLPGVQAMLVDENGRETAEGEAGELWIKSASVFEGYWGKPQATQDSFSEGWFKTGDVAQKDADGYFKILGRSSVDIIKTGGYKVSALEIEDVLRENPLIADCAVVGLDSDEWGQVVAVAFVPVSGVQPDLAELKSWAKGRMAAYKCPQKWLPVAELPKNAMGKTVKMEVKGLF